jgi:hypothetical protein
VQAILALEASLRTPHRPDRRTMTRRTRKTHPVREAASTLPPSDDTIPCTACGRPMPRARRDVAGLATCPACTERASFVEDVDGSKATGYEIRVAAPRVPTAEPAPQPRRTARPAAAGAQALPRKERPLQRNSSLEDALGLHARKGASASKVWGRRPAPVEDDETDLAREIASNRRERW